MLHPRGNFVIVEKQKMNKEALGAFLIKAKKSGYAAGGESVVTREADGSKSTRFEEGDFKFHDNYFGGEPFGGREVVHYNEKPYWMMVYYGADSGKAPELIPFLLKALQSIPEDMPVRGPKLLEDGKFVYRNMYEGDLERFAGEETISFDNQEVYKTRYSGGLVDQRKDQ